MTQPPGGTADIAIVGGGLAGAAMAIHAARRGHAVVVLERSPRWRWHACGVFASPAAIAELRSLGIDAAVLRSVARPIPAMQVETLRRTVFRLTYGAQPDGTRGAVGFDRRALDGALLDLARSSGARVLHDHTVLSMDAAVGCRDARLTVRSPAGMTTIGARLVVGADGIRSIVARDVGVARPARFGRRVGLTWHVPDPDGDIPHAARMVVLDGAYCGLAPVPGGRLNVGIVLSGRHRIRALRARGAAAVGAEILGEALDAGRGTRATAIPDALDAIAGAAPLGHRTGRRAGAGWMLIGDAAGFLDPFTGEGLHRALVSAWLAAEAVADRPDRRRGLAAYDRAMGDRFAAKDVLSLLVQAFLSRPALFEYAARRLAGRDGLRETIGLVMGDLVPAGRALDPRFVAALLAP